MKKRIGYLSILIFLTISVSVLKIVFSAATSTTGIDLNDIQTKEAVLEEENTQLNQTVYNLMSLNTISDKAKQEGFVPNDKSTIIVGTNTSFALKP